MYTSEYWDALEKYLDAGNGGHNWTTIIEVDQRAVTPFFLDHQEYEQGMTVSKWYLPLGFVQVEVLFTSDTDGNADAECHKIAHSMGGRVITTFQRED